MIVAGGITVVIPNSLGYLSILSLQNYNFFVYCQLFKVKKLLSFVYLSSYQSVKLQNSCKKIESNIISKFEVLQSHTQLFPNISADISKTTILL